MGSQQRNINLQTKLPIKSGGGYYMNNSQVIKTEFNPYQKYMDGNIKTKSGSKKKKGKKR